MLQDLFTAEGIVSLITLTLLEIILGIDNVIFISIVSGKLPAHQQGQGRTIGLSLALIVRILLLLGVSWLMHLNNPIFTYETFELTFKDLILLIGGLFLMAKSVSEIHSKLEGHEESEREVKTMSLKSAIIQIVIIDIIFSLDSILTAVGLAKNVVIIIAAILISMGVMLAFSKTISDFINKHPTMKMLALSFLIMIGFLLMVEGLHVEIDKRYIYIAMAFALIVELLNMRLRKKRAPVQLRNNLDPEENETKINF